ncbi:pancreatic lipase-related protein 2-like [Montipora capricornis]|uniref:pancreatic lipase-related protein 2-like n=2 Tax=Montipora TaxID=46703 RepID=UPI0035F14FB5
MKKYNLLIILGVLLLDHSSAFFGKGKVCYKKYGCFSHNPPFVNVMMWLPQAPETINTKFLLFTRSNKDYAQLMDDMNIETVEMSNFVISKRTILICHGWTEDGPGHNNWGYRLKDALLEREDCNVIVVDWSGGSKSLYEQSSGNTRLVGAQAAELIKLIIEFNGGSRKLADNFYFIGFSLGAQIAGYTGRRLRESNMVLGRITGLDPAGNYFSYMDPDVRLDPTDAKRVDVVHTNEPFVGTPQTVGHIDFFPNGGSLQPGCLSNPLDVFNTIGCNHLRSAEYYIASVQNKCSWKAYPCKTNLRYLLGLCVTCDDECPTLGFAADQTNKNGTYFMTTNSHEPFCGMEA